MTIVNFKPEIWTSGLQRALDKSLVFGALCNRDYEGDVRKQGDTVHILQLNDPTIAAYTEGVTTVTPEVLVGVSQDLALDKAYYYAVKIGDIEAVQSSWKDFNYVTQRAAQGLADVVDQYIAGLYASAGCSYGVVGTPIDVNSENIKETFAEISEELDLNNVPQIGRWIVIPGWLKKKLSMASVDQETINETTFRNGFSGRYLGYDVFVSNNCSEASVGVNSKVLAGTSQAITFAEQLLNVESYRDQSTFSDVLRGLHLWGCKVVQPDALCCAYLSEAAES